MKKIRRPTEEAALARIMRENKRKEEKLLKESFKRVVFDANGAKWMIWIMPEHRSMTTEDLTNAWQARAPNMSFLRFLERDAAIYRKEEILNADS